MIGDPTPDLNKTSAQLAANILLDIEAIHIRPDEPFTFTSGRLSPVYVDCRRIISYPRARSALMKMGISLLNHNAGVEAFDAVAGGETAGIPFAAWIAELLGLPMLYIRKQAKGFGRNARIEGTFKEGANILLVEDLATDGGSKISFINAIRDAGGTIAHCFVVFHYGNFPESTKNLQDIGVSLHGLCTWWDVLEVAATRNYTPEQLSTVRDFLDNPDGWADQNQLK
ncbi:orotate phosphoribosyltransferase [Rhodospirillaceae bacterium]|jgi:orotate phosphoribosyltransferase|nr:orotate phosphoribosyltransferase [Rhodospirillaceae bacterium]|tara:strand:+ start:1101 stop:1781 length:681 start_codon:yes stop_codon:yes gene_type:complete